MASLAAYLMASMCEMPSWLIGSPSWLMMKRTEWPSAEMKTTLGTAPPSSDRADAAALV